MQFQVQSKRNTQTLLEGPALWKSGEKEVYKYYRGRCDLLPTKAKVTSHRKLQWQTSCLAAHPPAQFKVQRGCGRREQSCLWPLTGTDDTCFLWLAFKISCMLTSGALTSACRVTVSILSTLLRGKSFFYANHHLTTLTLLSCNGASSWCPVLFCWNIFFPFSFFLFSKFMEQQTQVLR